MRSRPPASGTAAVSADTNGVGRSFWALYKLRGSTQNCNEPIWYPSLFKIDRFQTARRKFAA